MAWIVKNSAGMKVEKRPEPYLTDEMKARFTTHIRPRYETPQGALMPILHEIQHAYGWIPHQALLETAEFLAIPPATILDTVTFYEEYNLQPVGKYTISVCRSIACEACGHEKIVDHLRRKLNIEPGDTTPDGLFTLRTLECLGACEAAPCALVNEDRHDCLQPASLDALIEAIRANPDSHSPATPTTSH